MARPQITKRVCKEPAFSEFAPIGAAEKRKAIVLTVEEYEAIRLIDLDGMTREACAERMRIARTTAQTIYNSARTKIAESLVHGLSLRIEGGTFLLCDGSAGCPRCRRKEAAARGEGQFFFDNKEDHVMRIAVTYDNGNVFQHFGRTEYFKVYEVEGNEIKGSDVYSANGVGHGALAGLLSGSGIDVLICGGIGGGAITALGNVGIQVVAGASGDVDAAVAAYLAGELVSTGSNCNHHHHADGHSCGAHGCGHQE